MNELIGAIDMKNSQYKLRSRNLKFLGFASYEAYLNSKHWNNRRREFEGTHLRRCAYCGRYGDHLHHLNYETLGHERDEDIQWLCEVHHREWHRFGRIRPISDGQKTILLHHGYAESYVSGLSMGVAFQLIEKIGKRQVTLPSHGGNTDWWPVWL